MPRSRTSGQHVQGWVDTSAMATVQQWLVEQGSGAQSVSQLVGLVFDALAEIIIENGGQHVRAEHAEEVIENIGQRRKIGHGFGIRREARQEVAVSPQAIRMATTMYEQQIVTSNQQSREVSTIDHTDLENGESVSDADEGEFSSEVLRAQREEQP